MNEETAKPEKPKMTCEQAGNKGGKSLLKKMGKDYFRKIGRKGGNHTKMWHGVDGHYSKIGAIGGKVIAEKVKAGENGMTHEHYKKIGKKGGRIVREAFKELAARRAADAKLEAATDAPLLEDAG